MLQNAMQRATQPSQSLIKTISYQIFFRLSTAATKHGCKHEALAIAVYEKTMKATNANFVVTKCETIINTKYPFLHATPDFLCECDCCGQGCGEVKCPFCIEGFHCILLSSGIIAVHNFNHRYGGIVEARRRLCNITTVISLVCST